MKARWGGVAGMESEHPSGGGGKRNQFCKHEFGVIRVLRKSYTDENHKNYQEDVGCTRAIS